MMAGRLRKKVVVQQQVQTGQDQFKQPVVEWQTFATRRASIEPWRGKEEWQGDKVVASMRHKVTIRFTAGVTPKMRVSYTDPTAGTTRILNIESVDNVDERNREMVLHCTEEV